MRRLTFEQLRIKLTLTFDNLDEAVEIVKRGKVVGYIVKSLEVNVQGCSKTRGYDFSPDKPKVELEPLYKADPIPGELLPHPIERDKGFDVGELKKAIEKIQAKAAMKTFFRPMTKESQAHRGG